MKSKVTLITILLVFCFVLIPLLMSCNHTSGAAYVKEAGFKGQQHSLVINNPVLTAGKFHCLDITLTDDAQRISIVAYKGDVIPDVQNRTIKNYYRWEYDNGRWLDKSGYESFYIRPSQCKKNGHTYSFYIGLDARADTGDWTIKISVDNKDVYSSPLNVETIHFNILLFTIYTNGFKLDRNDLPEFFKKHRKINHQEQTAANKESLDDIEAFIDHFPGARSSVSQIKAFAIPVKKTSLYDELVDKLIKDPPSVQETDDDEEIENCYEAEKTIVVDSHLKVSTKKGVIPPPTRKINHLSFFSVGVAFLMAFLLFSLAFMPLITSLDVSIDSNSSVISSFTLSLDEVVNGDTIFLNVSTYNSIGISSVTADMGGIETMQLSLIDNSTSDHLWQAVWTVHDANPGDYFTTITALDNESNSYSAQLEWTVLSQDSDEEGGSDTNQTETTNEEDSNTTTDVSDFENEINSGNDTLTNETDGSILNETFNVENESSNETVFDEIVNLSSNDTIPVSGCINITAFMAKELIDSEEDIFILDVRRNEEYNSGYIEGALSIPLIDLGCDSCLQKILDEYKNDSIIVYGNNSDESEAACEILVEIGYTTIYNLKSGITAWINAGFSITVSPDESSVYSQIDQSLNDGKPVFLFFYINGCNHCQDEETILVELKEKYAEDIDFIYIHENNNPSVVDSFGVKSYPTMFLIVDKDEGGYIYEYFKGFVDKDELVSVFDIALDKSNYSTISDDWWHGNITIHRPLELPPKVATKISHGEDAQVIIQYKEGRNFTEETAFLDSLGFVPTAEISSKDLVAGTMNESVYDSIKYNSDILDVYEDDSFTVLLNESLPLVRFDDAFEEFGVTGSGKKICILDTGVDSSIVDYSYGYDFVNNDSIPDDEYGHGTMVASVIKSIAPDAELIVAKVINGSGVGYESDVLEALEWCIAQDPDVISFSIGSSGSCDGFCDTDFVANMSNDAVDSGIFVVAASGNDGSSSLKSPACGSKVFSVGAIDDNDTIAGFSNVNPTLDMFAPGVDIETNVGSGSGTSFSVPFVAGAAALVLEHEVLNPMELNYRLRSTGKPINYTYNSSLSLDVPRLDIYNALANNKTMEPYDYSWWWQGVLGDGEGYEPLAFSWFGVSKSEFDSCSDKDCTSCQAALDGTGFWDASAVPPNYFILDLTTPYVIDKVRGRSNRLYDPTDVEIYVSNDKESWGTAVASDISTWVDRTDWDGDAVIDTSGTAGRYIKVEVESHEVSLPGDLEWGENDFGTPWPIFDVYAEQGNATIYYFNQHNAEMQWNNEPDLLDDGDTATYAYTMEDKQDQYEDANTCGGADLGTISQVEIRVYGYDTATANWDIILTPTFNGDPEARGDEHTFNVDTTAGWSEWFDITEDTNAPETWAWSDVQELDCYVTALYLSGAEAPVYASKVEIRVKFNESVPNNAPTITSWNADTEPGATSGWDWDNNDLQVDWTVADADSDSLTLLWTFSKGGTPSDPTTGSYNGRKTGITSGSYTMTNQDLNWDSGDWSNYRGTVNFKFRLHDGTDYSTTIETDTLTGGIDGTDPDTTIMDQPDAEDGPDSIWGTATDTTCYVDHVDMYIKNTTDNTWWTGSGWSTETWLSASANDSSFNSASENWNYDSSGITWGYKNYGMRANTSDESGRDDSSPATDTFTITPPEPPEIGTPTVDTDPVGYGYNVTVNVSVWDNITGVSEVKCNVTYPDSTSYNFTMANTGGAYYEKEINLTDTWQLGWHNYTIWATDGTLGNTSSQYSFNVSAQCNVTVQTEKDSYGANEYVNLTDPPDTIGDNPVGEEPFDNTEDLGYELLDDNSVLHIWNQYNDYYFDMSNGLQFSNHYQEYWTKNVLMLGYYDGDEWNLIYQTDELSNFNKNITGEPDNYINTTLWKDLSYGNYDFRLTIRYHLGVNDSDLTIIPYIKNLGQAIPYVLGFGWEMKDIQIDATPELDYINVNRTSYYLNQTLNNTYTNLSEPIYCWNELANETQICGYTDPMFYLMENITDTSTKSLYLIWNKDLDYVLRVKNRTGQYNAPVTLFLKIGTLNAGQEKYTTMHWLDSPDSVNLLPDSEGSVQQWTPQPLEFPTPIHWNKVDDDPMNPPDEDETYVWTDVVDEIEDFNHATDAVLEGATITNVRVNVRAKAEYAVNEINIGVKVGVTRYGAAADTTLTGFYEDYYKDWPYNPAAPELNTPWTKADIDDLQSSIQSKAFDVWVRVTQVYITVTYTPNNAPTQSNQKIWNATTSTEWSLNATEVSLTPTCFNVTINDLDGDNMNVTIMTNESGSWTVVNQTSGSGLSNGTYSYYNTSWVNARTTYYISFNLTDGTDWCNETYHFTTYIQSKINNTGTTNCKGYLLMQIHYNDSGSWYTVESTIDETGTRTINASEYLKLDAIFNGTVYTSTNLTNGTGEYRVYVAFRDKFGSVLKNDDDTYMNASYAFDYTAAVVPNVAPVINSYNLSNSTGSKLNSLTGLLDVNNEYNFTVNITDADGWADIQYVNITAQYDNGSESTTYNQTDNLGGNLNMNLSYVNTTGTASYHMWWPDDEAELITGNCSETIINSTTRVINISFKPKNQVRYANTTGGWATTQNATNDLNSWNFNITVVDNSSAEAWKIDEYGVYKYTFIEPNQNWVDVTAAPGRNDTSSIVAVNYSSNYDFNMTIWFTENLTNQTKGTTILIANNVDILNNTDPNDDIDTGDITFNGIGEANAVDIFNTSGTFPKNNASQTVDVQFNVRIPIGTMWGVYTAHINVKIFQKT